MLSIRLLGSPEIMLDGRALNLTRRKSRALVYYLAAQSRPLSREHLVAFFWPDLDRPAAQQTFRTTLHGLRKALGAALAVDEASLWLSPGIPVDAHQFESRLRSPLSNLRPPTSDLPSLISILELYRGDFLEGFSLRGEASPFDDWLTAKREHYRRLAVRGFAALAKAREAQGDYAAALDALTRALAFDSLQEDLQRDAIRLHYLDGDRAGAIRRYDALRKLLDEEMGVPPMAETRALYDAIITDKLPQPMLEVRSQRSEVRRVPSDLRPLTPDIQSLPFIGRAAELSALRALMASGKLALIEGEPGLGKTRLAEEFIRGTDALALSGTARELEQTLPYQPVMEALRNLPARADWPALRAALQSGLLPVWLAECARLLPELAPDNLQSLISGPPSPADESRLWEGLHQLLHALARQRPVILFLDDLHWADASTLALLGYLTRRSRGEAGAFPILFVGATRPFAPRSPLAVLVQTLIREDRLTRLPLARLARADIAALVAHLCPASADPLADWLARLSEGNPYILAELVRHARAANILREDGTLDATALSASPIVPQSVYALIQSRLSRLSDAARRMLDAAVAVGREFESDIAARAAALSESAALDALDELRAAGLIYPDRDDPRGRLHIFDHTLTMEVAYREVGEARHRHLHRRVAEAMESAYRDKLDSVAGLLASHFAEGNAPERAAPYAFRAGQRAARLAAWKEAIAFYEQALDGTSDETQRAEVFLALGSARMQAGELPRASEALRAALAHPEADRVAEAQIALGQSLLMQARYAEVIDLARELLAAPMTQAHVHAEALWGTALSLEGIDLAGAGEHLRSAADMLRDESGPVDAPRLAQITFELGNVAAQQGNLPRAVELYREAMTIAEHAESDAGLPMRVLAHNNLAYHLHLLGDPAATEHANEGLRLAREKGLLSVQTFLLSTLGEIELARGDLDAAENRFVEGLALAEQLSIPERVAGLTANLGRLEARRGHTALAIHRLSTALARADALGTHHLAAQIRLWLAPLLPPPEARAALAEARAIAESGGRRRLLEEIERLEDRG
jgi:DNA-binding SARP family transcriptional activator